jgi:hypothetical protein
MNDPRTIDPTNLALLERRVKARNDLIGPRVGDWVRRPDGRETRITHVFNFEEKLVQDGGVARGQFHLLSDGHESYSGGLDSSFPATRLRLTGERKQGMVWIFDRDYAGAGRGVEFWIEERVYKMIGGAA